MGCSSYRPTYWGDAVVSDRGPSFFQSSLKGRRSRRRQPVGEEPQAGGLPPSGAFDCSEIC